MPTNLCQFGNSCRSFTYPKYTCHRYHPSDPKSTILNKKNLFLVQNFFDKLGFIYLDSGDKFKLFREKAYLKNKSDAGNWRIRFYRVKTSMLYANANYGSPENAFVILENSDPYDFETNKNKICPHLDEIDLTIPIRSRYDKPPFCCEKIFELEIFIDGNFEKFFCLMIWEKYKCGYRCNTNIYHPHGN